jgi:transposase
MCAMSEYVTIPLDIEGVKVDRVEVTGNGEIHIHVRSTVEDTPCHRCGRDIHRRYDEGREIKLRHLPIMGRPTYIFTKPIFTKPRRYRCDDCPGNPHHDAAPALV